MACGSCRKPKEIRSPGIVNTTPTFTNRPITVNGNDSQRAKVTGLTYVPKK